MATWSNKVNDNFYGADSTYKDNIEQITFNSGRVIQYLKNSSPKKSISVMLSVNDVNLNSGKTEFEWFLDWFENTLLSGAETLTHTDLVTGSGNKTYHLIGSPSWTGQAIKEISLSFEEA